MIPTGGLGNGASGDGVAADCRVDIRRPLSEEGDPYTIPAGACRIVFHCNGIVLDSGRGGQLALQVVPNTGTLG